MTTTPDIPEGLELRKDGTIVIHIDGDNGRTERVTLRRPKMKDLRRLRETEWEIAADLRSFLRPLQELIDKHLEANSIDLADPATISQQPTDVLRVLRDLQRDRDQQGTIHAEDLRGPWAAEVIELLGGKRIEEDDLPPWCFGADFSAIVLGHWLTVPTRRGSP